MTVTHVVVGVVEAVGVGYDLQEDVHLVQDGSERRIFPVIAHNLGRCESTEHICSQELLEITEKQRRNDQITFLANQVPLA